MNVLHVTGPARFGGIERLVLDLAHTQHVVQNMDVGILFTSADGEFYEQFARTGLPLYSAGLTSGYDFSPVKYRRAVRLFREHQILHFHSFNPLLAQCAISANRRVVYTEHGNFAFGRKAGISDAIKSRLLKYFLNRCVYYVSFNSAFTKSISEKRYDLRNVPRSIVYNGLAIDAVTRSTQQIEDTIAGRLQARFVVGTTSRFAGFKRIDRLISAFAEFQADKADVVLLLVGDGILRRDLEQLVDRLGISDKTIFVGYRENVYDFQSRMDVCVFPSEKEPFGIAAAETMLLGKPTIICHDGGGLVEVVGGYLTDDVVSSAHGMAERLNHYYMHRGNIAGAADKRRRYASRFNIEDTASQFRDIYQKVLSSVSSPGHVRN